MKGIAFHGTSGTGPRFKNSGGIGGTSGIGLTLAKGLAQAGADVIPSGRRTELVKSAADETGEMGRKTLAVPSDVTYRASLEALLGRVLAKFRKVDILVNCAGCTQRGAILDLAESEWNSILETNLNGTLRACQIFGRKMWSGRRGNDRHRLAVVLGSHV